MAEIFTDSIGRYTNETILEAIRNYTKISLGCGGGSGMLNLLSLNGLSWLLAEEGWTSATNKGLDNAHQPAVAMHQSFDRAGVITVGPGITNTSRAGKAIVAGKSYTFEECIDFLAAEISGICDGLQGKVPDVLQIDQRCTDALIVYHFNTGNAYGRWSGCTTANDIASKIINGPKGSAVDPNILEGRRGREAGIANGTITLENAPEKARAYFEIHPLAEEIMKLKGVWTGGMGPGDASIMSAGMAPSDIKLPIQNQSAYNLVLYRYKRCPSGIGDGHNAVEGMIFEYNTKKIITYTIEDETDIRNTGFGLRYKNPYKMIPAGNSWPSSAAHHKGPSKYCVSLSQGRGGFGSSMGASKTMLATNHKPGCLFHQGSGTNWSEGCILCGEKAVNGRRTGFNKTAWYPENIMTTTNNDVRWWKNLYNAVVPKICNGTTVHLYVTGVIHP